MRFAILFISALFTLHLTNDANAEQDAVWIGMSDADPRRARRHLPGNARRKIRRISASPNSRPKSASPEFLALHPNGKRLYAACQLGEWQTWRRGVRNLRRQAIAALLEWRADGRRRACHLAVDRSGRCLFTAQYGTGSVAAFPLAAGWSSILPRSALVRHTGSGPNHERQEGPHPHWVGTDPTNRFLFVPDLGSDRVVIYEMDLDNWHAQSRMAHGSCPAGSGPRHLVFHPNGRFAYVVNEMQISVTAFAYDAQGRHTESNSNDRLVARRAARSAELRRRRFAFTRAASFCTPPPAATTRSARFESIRKAAG